MFDASFEYSFRLGLSFLLSLSAGIMVVPFGAYYAAILVGFPFTALIRKLTAQHKSLTIDISFIKVIANLIDGFLAAMLAKMLFNLFDVRFRVLVLFLMGAGKVIYSIKRNDMFNKRVILRNPFRRSNPALEFYMKKKDDYFLLEEILDIMIYFIGLFLAHRLFPYF
ncbi:MAG: hypothetical protein K8R90_07140 [Candidatus Cloacimonetes bacterium]|nr:hypothetical protein [Candidatus Cloacimonadota bacterium]